MCQGTGKICSLSRGFVVSQLFSICFTIADAKIYRSLYRGLCYNEVRKIEVSLYQNITQELWNADEMTHTSLSASCSLRESESEATLPSSFSLARLTRLISSSLSAPLRSRWLCNISICLSLSRIVASRLEMVLDELECSDLTENS